jgi:hypothetical protein
MVVAALLAVNGLSGCSTLDRAYKQEVTWTNAPVVQVVTNRNGPRNSDSELS